MPQESSALRDLFNEYNSEHKFATDYNEFKEVMSDEANRKDFFNEYNDKLKLANDFNEFESVLGVKKSTPPQGGISNKGSLSSTPILKTGSSGSTGLKSQSNVAKTDFSQGALNFQQAYAKQVADKTGTSTAPKFKTYSVIDQSKEAKAARVQEKKKAEELVSKIAIDEANAKKQNKEASAYDYLLSGLGDVAGAFATTMASGGNNPMYGGYAPNDKVTTKEDLQKAASIGNAVSESIGANARENIEQSGNVNEGNPLKSFQEGDISGGIAQTAKSIVGSTPAMLSMMNPATLASYAVGSIGRETDKLEKEGVPSDKALLSATTKIGADIALERLFGGAKILKNIIAKSGKAAAKETLKKAIIKNIGQNASEEGVAQLIQNASQIYIEDKKDIGLLDNVPNSVIIGGASGSFFTPLVILQKNAEKAIEEKAKQDEDNLRQEQLGMAYENNKQEELKEQQLNQEYNESKSSNEGQAIEGNVSESGIISEGQGDRQSERLQGREQGRLEIGQNASDENGSQEITNDAIQEPSPESEVSRIGEGGENAEIDSTGVRPINEGEKVAEEVTQEEVTPIGNEVVESVVTGQKPIADLTENELSSASESIADDISKANSKQQEIATDIKKANYDSIKRQVDNAKSILIALESNKNASIEEIRNAKSQVKDLVKKQADLSKWLIKNNYGIKDKSLKDIIESEQGQAKGSVDSIFNNILDNYSSLLASNIKSVTDKAEYEKKFEKYKSQMSEKLGKSKEKLEQVRKEKDFTIAFNKELSKERLDKLRNDKNFIIEFNKELAKEKFNNLKDVIKENKSNKSVIIEDFINSINPKAKLGTKYVKSLMDSANKATPDALLKKVLRVADYITKSELTANFNDVKKQVKSIKHTMVKNNIALGNAIAGIKNLPEVFKKDFVADVNRLLDTYKMYNQFDTKLANEIIDKYKPIEEQFAVEKQREKTYRIFEENKLYGARDISEFTQEEIEDAVADFESRQKQADELDLGTEVEPTEAEKQKEKADTFAEEFHTTINDLLDLFDYEVLQPFKDISASEISKALILGNGKFNKKDAKNLNEVAQNMYNGDTESGINIIEALSEQINNDKKYGNEDYGKVNLPGFGKNYKGFWNSLDSALKQGLQTFRGIDSLLLMINNNNKAKSEKMQEFIGRGLVFKNISDKIIAINSRFETTLSNINEKAGFIYTRSFDARKNQTVVRILNQVKQIKTNLDIDEQVSAIVKRIQEVLASKSRLENYASKAGSNGVNVKQELDAHNDFLKKIEGIGIKTDGTTVIEFPFEDFASFEKAINSIQEYKAHNDTLSAIAKYLKENGYADIMDKHSINGYGITLESYTNYIPLFYQRVSTTEDGTIVVPGTNLTPDVASAVKQRRGLGGDQYLAGDFFNGLLNTHNQSISDAMLYKQNLITDATLNSKYVIDAFNAKVTETELKDYNQGVSMRGMLKNIYSKQLLVQKYGSFKDAAGKVPLLDNVSTLISKSNKVALMNVLMFLKQSASQSLVTFTSTVIKRKALGKQLFFQNSLPILPKDMQYSNRGRVAELAGLGEIVNEATELATDRKSETFKIGAESKLLHKAKVVEKTFDKATTNIAKWNTAGADFLSRSFIFYTWIQSEAHAAGMDVYAPDFWSKIEQGMINNDIEILKITQRAKDESNVQGNLNKSFGSDFTNTSNPLVRLFRVTLANMKGFSMLQYGSYVNKRKILFNSSNNTEDRIAASIDIFGLSASAAMYGMAGLYLASSGLSDEVADKVSDAFNSLVGGGDEEDKEIDKLTKESRKIKTTPTTSDYGFVAMTSIVNMNIPEMPLINPAVKFALSESGAYEEGYKAWDKTYRYLAENVEKYAGEDKYKYANAAKMMSKGVLPFKEKDYMGITMPNTIELAFNTSESLYAVCGNDDLNDSAKRQYAKAAYASLFRLTPYVPIVNSIYGVTNIAGVDKAIVNSYNESVKNAEAIAGIDKEGVMKFNKQYTGNAIKLRDKEIKAKTFAKESIGTLKEVEKEGSAFSKIKDAAQNAIVRDFLKKFKK